MKNRLSIICQTVLSGGAALLLLGQSPVEAGEQRLESIGGDITLAAAPLENGIVRGVLKFDLEPGWKTYWRDPGMSGIPPQLSAEATPGVQAVTIHYPAPIWISSDDETWAGYTDDIALPFEITVDEAVFDGTVAVDVFAGICEEICIPVFGQLTANVSTADALSARMEIGRALMSLPAQSAAGLAISAIDTDSDAGTVRVAVDAARHDGLHVFATGLDGDGKSVASYGPPRTDGDGRFVFQTHDDARKVEHFVVVVHEPGRASVQREVSAAR